MHQPTNTEAQKFVKQLEQDALKKAYTGLPVVRVTQKQKALSELGCIELQGSS